MFIKMHILTLKLFFNNYKAICGLLNSGEELDLRKYGEDQKWSQCFCWCLFYYPCVWYNEIL